MAAGDVPGVAEGLVRNGAVCATEGPGLAHGRYVRVRGFGFGGHACTRAPSRGPGARDFSMLGPPPPPLSPTTPKRDPRCTTTRSRTTTA